MASGSTICFSCYSQGSLFFSKILHGKKINRTSLEFQELREKNPQLNVDESDGAGRTALHFAAVGPHLSGFSLLFEKKMKTGTK